MAAWKQAARAEAARALLVHYGQALLDLVKAFERIPHDRLLHEARLLGYLGWLIRLAVATYRLQRVVPVGDALSQMVTAVQGITAGSASATTEMRVMMIRLVDRACLAYPLVTPTLFVDDLAGECSGGPAVVCKQMVGLRSLCGSRDSRSSHGVISD